MDDVQIAAIKLKEDFEDQSEIKYLEFNLILTCETDDAYKTMDQTFHIYILNKFKLKFLLYSNNIRYLSVI